MTREDIECIIKWFSHIEQLATDGKTANGFQMPTDKVLATIKVVAKDSREYVEKFCNDSVPNDLEEAAKRYGNNKHPMTPTGAEESKEDFIAGAKWQEKQNLRFIKQVLSGDFTVFEAGRKYERKQMMKEAVEGEIVKDISDRLAVTAKNVNLDKFKFGDKVRIVVCKKED